VLPLDKVTGFTVAGGSIAAFLSSALASRLPCFRLSIFYKRSLGCSRHKMVRADIRNVPGRQLQWLLGAI